MKFDITDILKFYSNVIDNKMSLSNDELMHYMNKSYNFSKEDYEPQTVLLINNFLLTYSEIVNDLKEITERIKNIDEKMSQLNSGDYEFRKLKYFKDRNIKAKIEIEEFLMNNVAEYVRERVVEKKNWIRSSEGLSKIFDRLPYNYSYYKRYYDSQFDFSTESKFFFLLNHNREAIDTKINIKKDDPEKYYYDIDKLIKSEELLKKILFKVESHHRLKNRKEIFETLYGLYENGLYQSFINLAVIQIEGLFHDLCVVINDEKETNNMGTISEKAEKIFKANFVLWLSIYPYYAFEFPIYRNKIAHSGLWTDDNFKDFANELILDLYTILEVIKLPYIPPNNLLILFVPMRQKINHLEFTEDDYETILVELFSSYQFDKNSSKSIFDFLKERDIKRDLLEHYIIPVSNNVITNLYEECNRLINVIYNEKFWDIILRYTKEFKTYNPGKPYDFIEFVSVITNNYIGEFKQNTTVKDKCIEVKKEIKRFIIK